MGGEKRSCEGTSKLTKVLNRVKWSMFVLIIQL